MESLPYVTSARPATRGVEQALADAFIGLRVQSGGTDCSLQVAVFPERGPYRAGFCGVIFNCLRSWVGIGAG